MESFDLAPERNRAAQVADRASSIRISGLRLRYVAPVVFVQITTNRGVSGWGDIKAIEPRSAMALAESLFELLDGENPTRIEHLWQKLYRSHRDMRGTASATGARCASGFRRRAVRTASWPAP